MIDHDSPPIMAVACECFGVDLMYEAAEEPVMGREHGQPCVILAFSDWEGDTSRASLTLEDARYLLRELARVLDEHDAEA